MSTTTHITANEIRAGNKLIAEFMKYDRYSVVIAAESFLNRGYYHKNWAWLMPVWVKISELKSAPEGAGITVMDILLLKQGGFSARINYRTKFAGINSKHKWFENTVKDPLIATYRTVVQFIQWYNTQTNDRQ